MRHCPKVAALQLVCSLTVRRKASESRWQELGLTSTTVRRFKLCPLDLATPHYKAYAKNRMVLGKIMTKVLTVCTTILVLVISLHAQSTNGHLIDHSRRMEYSGTLPLALARCSTTLIRLA